MNFIKKTLPIVEAEAEEANKKVEAVENGIKALEALVPYTTGEEA